MIRELEPEKGDYLGRKQTTGRKDSGPWILVSAYRCASAHCSIQEGRIPDNWREFFVDPGFWSQPASVLLHTAVCRREGNLITGGIKSGPWILVKSYKVLLVQCSMRVGRISAYRGTR